MRRVTACLLLLVTFRWCFADWRDTPNVGTTLFSREKLEGSECWSATEVALLHARRVLQGLVPKETPPVNDQFVPLIIRYFHSCVTVTKEHAGGQARTLMMKALADVFGGYLTVYVLPEVKLAFYAGIIDYEQAKQAFSLLESLKSNILHTNGGHWLAPLPANITNLQITSIKIPADVTADVEACARLITYDFIRRKRSSFKESPSFELPLPYLDNELAPAAVAIPYLHTNLVNLQEDSSECVLLKYYITVSKCLVVSGVSAGLIKSYNWQLHHWLVTSVVPHLVDGRWYPAFGGVLKVLAAMEENHGLAMPQPYASHRAQEDDYGTKILEAAQRLFTPSSFSRTKLIVGGILLAILLWIILTACFCLITRILRKKRALEDNGVKTARRKESNFFNTFVDILYNQKDMGSSNAEGLASSNSSKLSSSVGPRVSKTQKKDIGSKSQTGSRIASVQETIMKRKVAGSGVQQLAPASPQRVDSSRSDEMTLDLIYDDEDATTIELEFDDDHQDKLLW